MAKGDMWNNLPGLDSDTRQVMVPRGSREPTARGSLYKASRCLLQRFLSPETAQSLKRNRPSSPQGFGNVPPSHHPGHQVPHWQNLLSLSPAQALLEQKDHGSPAPSQQAHLEDEAEQTRNSRAHPHVVVVASRHT